jgi:hypothetical protein
MTDETVELDEPVDAPVEDITPKKVRKRTKAGTFEPTMDIADYEDTIRELRDEAAKLRKRQTEDDNVKAEKLAEERIKVAREDAIKAAQEQLDQFKKEMQETAKARVLKSELKAAATKANVIDFEDLFAVMRNLDQVQYSEDGDVTNAAELIEEIKSKKPHLFASFTTSSTSQPPRATGKPPIEKIALTMSREDYERGKKMLDQI